MDWVNLARDNGENVFNKKKYKIIENVVYGTYGICQTLGSIVY